MPTLGGAEILAAVPGPRRDRRRRRDRPRPDAGEPLHVPGAVRDLWSTIREALADPTIDGVVVVQGTDTIEETAFFFDLLHAGDAPIVVTGAMRSASSPDYDGPANLRRAVAAAAAPALRGAGAVVVLSGSIEPADDVTKTHASSFDTFQSLNTGPLGRVDGDRVVVERARGPRRHVAATRGRRARPPRHGDGRDGRDADRRAAWRPAPTASSSRRPAPATPRPALLAAAERAMAAGLPVALTTRSPSGAASADYAFPGGGATWVRAGAMLAGHLGGPKARVALALGLGRRAGPRRAWRALLADPGASRAVAR